MIKIFSKRKNRIQSELSWKDRHPIKYDSGPSKKDLEWLEDKIEKDKEKLLDVQ